jgi:hypothetical protein
MPLGVLRGSMGFVPQEPFLFSDTLADNVAFGLDGREGQEGQEGREGQEGQESQDGQDGTMGGRRAMRCAPSPTKRIARSSTRS